jgi:methylthioribose-1-phosphate isomerase
VTRTAGPLLAESVLLRDEADGGGVDVLDRRVYPHRIRWVHCPTVGDVATAIRDMVTQSSGPVFAASAGLVLAARAGRDLPAPAAATLVLTYTLSGRVPRTGAAREGRQ